MTIEYTYSNKAFGAEQVMWASKELVNALVERALASQTEAFIDMIMDGNQPEMITRAGVNETLRGVKESAADFLNDMIGDLQRAVEKRLAEAQYGASVTGIKYDLSGAVTDIEVNMSVS